MLIRSVLFNFQGAFNSSLSGDFVIISHLFEFVKYFLKISFEIFLIFSHFRRDLWGLLTALAAAYLLYHFISVLSSTF